MPSTPTPAAPKPASPSADADLVDYVVTGSGITYRVGRAVDAVRRFEHGAVLRLHSSEARVKDLVRSKSIAPKADNAPRSTASAVFRAMGADDDPAQPPVQDVQPVRAEANPSAGAPTSDAE